MYPKIIGTGPFVKYCPRCIDRGFADKSEALALEAMDEHVALAHPEYTNNGDDAKGE